MTDNCKHVVKIKTSIQLGILNPERWHCKVCNTTESVWACLSCTNFACGRYISEHALQHFQTTGHPLCIEVNEKFVFCYICDDFVLNDNAPGDIKLLRMALDAVTEQNFEELSKQRRGRRILRYHMRDCKKVTRRLLKADDIQTAVVRHRLSRLSWALRLWWSRYLEKKTTCDTTPRIRAVTGKRKSRLSYSSAFTGLRNLGNTCYMNSVLQVLRHTASFANFILSHSPSEVLPHSRKRRPLRSGTESETSEPPTKRLSICPPLVLKGPTRTLPHDCAKTQSSACSTETSTMCSSDGTVPGSPCSRSTPLAYSTDCSSVKTELEPGLVHDASAGGGLNGGRCAVARSDDTRSTVTPTSVATDESPSVNRSLYEELYGMFRTLWSGQRTVVSPSSLLYAIWTALPSFKGYRQQDAQEFLSVFLDRLQSELHGDSQAVSVNSRDFVNRTFQGYCVSHVRCSVCNVVVCTEEPFSELSLALPLECYTGDSTECDLIDLLNKFFSPTPIDGASYACRQCNRKISPREKTAKPLVNFDSRDSFDSCMSSASTQKPTPFCMDQLVSVTLSRLSSPPTDTLPFSSYGMKARHHPTSQTVSTNSISTSSSSSSSLSSLSSGASPSLSTSLDDLDETPMMMSTVVPASPIAVHSTSVASPSLTIAVATTSSTEAVKATPTTTLGTPTAMAVTGSSTSIPTPHGSASLSRSELESGSTVQLTSATQTIRLTRLPRVLRLHIKRFRWIGRQREKVGCHVSFPLILDVSDFMLNCTDQAQCNRPHQYSPHQVDRVTQVNLQTPCTEVNPFMNSTTTPISPSLSSSSNCARFGEPQSGPMARRFLYHLTGVIVHHGRGFQSGHYTAYCLNDQPECWLNCNDASVTLCDFSEVAAAQAYLLFYSELMPTSPYPLWFNGFSQTGDLKCTQSSLPRVRSFHESVASTSGPGTMVTPTELKAGVSMKRSVSTSSHALQLRSTQPRRSSGSNTESCSRKSSTDCRNCSS